MLIIELWLKKWNEPKAAKSKINDRFRITKYKKIFNKGYTFSVRNIYYSMVKKNFVLKASPWTYKIKI